MSPCKHGHHDGAMHVPCPHCRNEYLEGQVANLRAALTAASAPAALPPEGVLHRALQEQLAREAAPRERQSAAPPAAPKCPVCQGDGADAPCAHPSEGLAGCLRDARLRSTLSLAAAAIDAAARWADAEHRHAKNLGAGGPGKLQKALAAGRAAEAAIKKLVVESQVYRAPFQARVQPWMMACFGEMVSGDREERNHRFLEEALELVQACGCSAGEAHQLVDYVFGRPVGEKPQEVGGVMVTLAALCLAHDMDMHAAGDVELARVWTKMEAIRAKQATKPKYGPLPGVAPAEECEVCGGTMTSFGKLCECAARSSAQDIGADATQPSDQSPMSQNGGMQ